MEFYTLYSCVMGLLTVGFRGWRDKSQLSVAMMPRRFRRLFIRILTKWRIMFSTRLWKGPLKRKYEQPDTPKFKTRSPALRSATTEAGENIWDVGVRSVWLTSLGAVFPNCLFHGGTGKISFLTSENEKKHFLGDIWNLSLYLDYLFIYLFTGQLPPGGYPMTVKCISYHIKFLLSFYVC